MAKLTKQVGFCQAIGQSDISSADVYLVVVFDNRDNESSIMEKDGWLEWAKMPTNRLRSTLSSLRVIV